MTAPECLYHYTSAEGMVGIISSRALWATDAEFLNDAQELRFGRDELYEALISTADELERGESGPGGPNGSRATVMRSAAGHLRPGGVFASKIYHSVYVSCFCEDGDLLSQWRGYGMGDGYAIGFSSSSLATSSELDGLTRPELAKIRYGRSAVAAMISKILRDVAPIPVGHPGAHGYFRARELVLPQLGQIKHEAFSEEREWRLLAAGEATPLFRTGSLGVIPYVALPLAAGAIMDIRIGPHQHAEVAVRGVQRLLEANGLENVPIRQSEARYRG